MSTNNHFWYCNVCNAQNSRLDGECQFCQCEGIKCQRDNCSGPNHGYTMGFDDHGRWRELTPPDQYR